MKKENIITEDLRSLFSSKDSFIWFTMFEKFTNLGVEDERFADFLRAFKTELKTEIIGETSFVALDENRGTKDKAVIAAKLNLLMELMCRYFDISQDSINNESILTFVQENVDAEIVAEDIELYTEMLSDLIDGSQVKSIAIKNKPSVISVIAFACANDIDLDGCMVSLIGETNFSENQKDNYLIMKERLGVA